MAAPKVNSERNKQIKARHTLEEKRRKIADELKAVEKQIAEIDEFLIETLLAADEDRVEIAGGIGIRLTRSTMPTVKDWDALYQFIHKNKAYYLLERRVGVTAFRELLEAGKPLPGVESYTKVKVNLVK